jgi:hypothetical protein
MESIAVGKRMKSSTKRKAVKFVSDESLKPMSANNVGSRESEILRSLDRLHAAVVTRSDALNKAIVDLAAVIPALSQAGSHPQTACFVSSSDNSEATPTEFHEIKRQIKELVNDVLPRDAVVVVVNKGDEELLELGARIAGHFPQAGDGRYSGYHPESSDAAILQLEELRFRGAEYLLFPCTAFWWIDHYVEFKQYLDKHYRLAKNPTNICLIYDLSETGRRPSAPHAHGGGKISQYLENPRDQIDHEQIRKAVDSVLPPDAVVAVVSKGDDARLDLCSRVTHHFPPAQPGRPAGVCPADSTSAVQSLKEMCEMGVQYLLLPTTTLWWLDYYGDLKQYLEAHAKLVLKHPACSIWHIYPA